MNNTTPHSETSDLLTLAQQGDQDAFADLIVCNKEVIQAGITKYKSLREDEKDSIEQTVTLKVREALSDFHRTEQTFPSWLNKMTEGVCCNVLLERAKKREPDAFYDLIEYNKDVIHGSIKAFPGLREEDREDIIQMIFEKAWRSISDFHSDQRHSFRAWLGKIARGTCFDKTRRHGFKLTEQSLELLRDKEVPDDVLSNLSSLKGKEFVTKKGFLRAIEKQVGKAQIVTYKELILEHAKIDDWETRESFLPVDPPTPIDVLQRQEQVEAINEAIHSNRLSEKQRLVLSLRYSGLSNQEIAQVFVIFKFTNQSLDNLRKEGIPEKILEKLKVLEDKEFIAIRKSEEMVIQGDTDNQFSQAVKQQIGEEQTARYKSLILKYSQQSFEGSKVAVEEFDMIKMIRTVFLIIQKLTERSLDNLKGSDVPDQILVRLRSLKQRKFVVGHKIEEIVEWKNKEGDFLTTVRQCIGKKNAEKYTELIVKYAQQLLNNRQIADIVFSAKERIFPILQEKGILI